MGGGAKTFSTRSVLATREGSAPSAAHPDATDTRRATRPTATARSRSVAVVGAHAPTMAPSGHCGRHCRSPMAVTAAPAAAVPAEPSVASSPAAAVPAEPTAIPAEPSAAGASCSEAAAEEEESESAARCRSS